MTDDAEENVSDFSRIVIFLLVSVGVFNGLAHSQSSEVTAAGNVSSRSITIAESLRFTMTIKNRSSGALITVRVISAPDDYHLQQICTLTESQDVKCYSSQDLSSSHNIFAPCIQPNHSFTAWGYLRPKATHKTESLTLVVGWTSSADNLGSSIGITLGDNEVQSKLGPYQPVISDILKSLLVPVTLAIFGTILTMALKRRDERQARTDKEREKAREEAEKERERTRQAAEKERDELRQERQREQALKAETWKQMLPLSHDCAAKYYLPLSNATERFSFFLRKKNERVAFFYLLSLNKKMADIIRALGGFYFKSLLGEALAAECWHRQKRFLLGDDDAPLNVAIKASISRFEAPETYQSFMAKFGPSDQNAEFKNTDVQRAWELFLEFLADDSRVAHLVGLLGALSAVLDYEANRPYEYWYDSPALLRVDEQGEKILRDILQGENITQDQIDAYLAGRVRRRED